MPKSIISEGKTSTEAIEKGLRELKVSKNQVDIKILEEKKKSFFNILDPHVVKVELTLKEDVKIIENKEKAAEKNTEKKEVSKESIKSAKLEIEEFLSKFLKEISDSITYKIEVEESSILVTIEGENSTRLIGYRGEALNSLQVILSTIASKNRENAPKVILDIGNYKDTRKKTLEELAEKVAKTVKRTGKNIALEPMTAYERKIIHTQLQNNEFVKTYSIGEGEKRRIVIAKNN